MQHYNKLIFILMLLLLAGATKAQVTLPPFFNCNMVLQKGIEIPVWGWASPGEKVTVTFEGTTVSDRAGKDGKWRVTLPAMNYGGPYKMIVKGKNLRTIENIMIGEVWVCSGQSNMEMKVANVKNAEAEIAASDYPEIRLFTVKQRISQFPQDQLDEGEWWECSPISVPDFSAVAYFFGRDLYQKLKVPIGLIHTSWGGTVVESWMSPEAIAQDPDLAGMLDKLQKLDWENYATLFRENLKNRLGTLPETDEGMKDGNALWAATVFDDKDWKTMKLPGYIENNGLEGVDGIVWFRKEIEIDPTDAEKPANLLLARIDDSDITFLNGEKIGETTQKYDAYRKYQIPAGMLKAGKNILTIRVEDTGGNGGVYGAPDEIKLVTPSKEMPLAGDWKFKLGKVDVNAIAIGPNDYPTLLYNAMIKPLIPYGIRGAIWYQGESNAERAQQYQRIFPNLIKDWRNQWNQGPFPFLFVQLANYMSPSDQPSESDWAELREAQTKTLALENTGMAVIIDAGEAKNIHPADKQTVGHRLALSARKVAYNEDLVYSGPMYNSMIIEGNKIIVTFDHVANGLMVKDKYGYVNGFAVAGANKKFYWAKAKIMGKDRIEITSPDVEKPIAVRYAWADNPDDVNLYNSENLPASPFRTDDWK